VISSERRADVQLILSNDAMTHSATTPQASYFGLKEGTPMPNEIFGTFTTPSTRKPTFNSLNYLKPLPSAIGARFGGGGSNETDTTTFHVVKMFSDRSLLVQQDDDGTSTLLDDLFGRYNVVKTVEKTWFAYPRLAPVRNPERDYAPVRPDQGLYYVNAMERLVSTMETEVRFLTFRFVLSFSILLNFRRERKGTGD
jgi:prenylcysteine oxidase/farnesylcysteine lyase